MNKSRTEAFSDGVLAVAITLLVLDLHTDAAGHEPLSPQLRAEWPSFLAYAVSFLIIGVIWVNHHALFALVDRVDRMLLFENLLLLMFATTVPFTTSTLAAYIGEDATDARWAVALYGISSIGMSIAFTAMLSRMVRHGLLRTPVSADVGRRAVRRFGLGSVAYPVMTVLALLWPPLVLIAFGGLAVYYMFDQTPVLPA